MYAFFRVIKVAVWRPPVADVPVSVIRASLVLIGKLSETDALLLSLKQLPPDLTQAFAGFAGHALLPYPKSQY